MEEILAISLTKIAQCFAAAFVMAAGAIGASMAQGNVAAKACESVSNNPQSEKTVYSMFLMALAIIETSAIYCLVIAFVLIKFF